MFILLANLETYPGKSGGPIGQINIKRYIFTVAKRHIQGDLPSF